MESTLIDSKDKKKNVDRLKMWCECCGVEHDRWDIDMVEPEDSVFEVNAIENVEYNFACPTCVTELRLVPMDTKRANEFRLRNEILMKQFAPRMVH